MIVPCIVNSWLYVGARSRELGADHQRQDAADDEEGERRDQVHVADDLVVGRGQDHDDLLAQGALAHAGTHVLRRVVECCCCVDHQSPDPCCL
jgi:hypothetical protein